MYRNVIPYTPEILATLVGHQVGTVEKALEIFRNLELIEILDNGAIYMMDIQNFIGQSSTEADRQRAYYNRVKGEKALLQIPENGAEPMAALRETYLQKQNRRGSQRRQSVTTPRILKSSGPSIPGKWIRLRHTRSTKQGWKMVSPMNSC